MIKINSIVLLLVLFSTSQLVGQQLKEQLLERVNEKKDMSEIVREIDQFYREIPRDHMTKAYGGIPKMKHLKKWEWYLSGRLDESGNVANVDSLMNIAEQTHERRFKTGEGRAPVLWQFVGPTNYSRGIARVDRLAFHPTNEDIIYAGTPRGGLWRTTNGGNSWTNITDNINNPGISGIAINQSNPNIIYIMTGDADSAGFVEIFGYKQSSRGIYRSSDGGNTWIQWDILGLDDPYDGYQLILHPNNDGDLYAATSKGLWHRVQDIFGNWVWEFEIDGHFWDVKFKPGDPSVVYASGNGTIYRSVNSGATWGTTTYGLLQDPCADVERIQLAVSPDDASVVYALMGPVTESGKFCGLYKSTDEANNFTRVRRTPNILGRSPTGNDADDQSNYDLTITANPSDADEIFTGGIYVWQSTNGGSTLNYLNSSTTSFFHADVHDLKFNPLDGNLYAATDGGVHISTDKGVTWTAISNNLRASQYYRMSGSALNFNELYVGAQDNGFLKRFQNTSNFNLEMGGDGFASSASRATSDETVFATVNAQFRRFDEDLFGQLGISPNLAPQASSDVFFKNIATHITDQNIVLLGGRDIWRATNAMNNTLTWTNEGASGSWALTHCLSNENRFYSAGGDSYRPGAGSIYRSDDEGLSWTDIKINGFPTNFTKITDIGVSPTSSDYVCASFGGFTSGVKVARSNTAGNSWTNISYNLPNAPINCIAINDGFDVYVGTDIGVYRLPNGTTTWTYVSPTIPRVPVTDLIIYDQTDQIYASTFGRGVYRSALGDLDCVSVNEINQTLSGVHNFESSNSIISTSIIEFDSQVQMKAKNRVILRPGFITNSTNSIVRAYIGGCEDSFDPSN